MTYGYDDVTGTTMSAQTEVQLNAGTSLTAPDPAHKTHRSLEFRAPKKRSYIL